MKKAMSLVLVFVMILSLAACSKKDSDSDKTTSTPAPTQAADATKAPDPTKAPDTTEPVATPTPEIPWDGAYMDREDFRAYIEYDLEQVLDSVQGQLKGDTASKVSQAVEDGIAAVEAGNTVAEIEKAYDDTVQNVINAIPAADGIYSYAKLDYDGRTDILGILERYAVTNGMTGISLYENGGYVMYNPRITLGTENYIVGYGFGTLAEGTITADLDYETVPEWKRYFHTMESSDPGTLNYLNDKGSQVGDLYGYIATSFVETFMNATKDGYDWVPTLAKEKPVAMNDDDGDGLATKWRMEVRTGDDGLKYKTGSTMANRQAFDNRPVALEDYETAWKLLCTQKNAYARGSETANQTSGAIVGIKEFYNATADGYNEAAWQNVGIKTYNENGKNYFEFEFTDELNSFYAMYYITSSLYMPVPQEFIDLVTPQNYLGFNKDGNETPVDNSLSLGAFYLEAYNSDQQIVFKKNPNYVFADTKFNHEGVHVKIFTAAETDPNATFNEFIAGHFDSAGIPQEFLNDYKNDPRTRTTTGDSNFKLNVNATTPETWEYLFGENGVVQQNAKSDYWESKPALGNAHFRKGISYSIDRITYANARGSIPSVDFLSSNYMSDPENGKSYAKTAAHAAAVKGLLEGTDEGGFSLELAREYFRLALTELEAEGAYKPGTKDNPTVISLEFAWMRPAQEEQYFNELKNFLETAFNDDSVTGGAYKLECVFWVGADWSDVYYNKMLIGQFDIGFGSISGNALNPLDFITVLSSDQDISGGFTLNWGVDTNSSTAFPLVYDGVRWSFDALVNAGNTQAIVKDGENKVAVSFDYHNLTKNADGLQTASFDVELALPDKSTFEVTQIMCCNYDRYRNGDGNYVEKPVEFTVEDKGNGKYTVNLTVPADVFTEFTTGEGLPDPATGETGFDLYYNLTLDGTPSSSYNSVNDTFVLE